MARFGAGAVATIGCVSLVGHVGAQEPDAGATAPSLRQAAISQTTPFTPPPQWQAAAQRAWLGPWSPPAPGKALDPLVPSAIAELAAGGALVLVGPIAWGTADTRSTCGRLAGCFEELSDAGKPVREAGASMTGIGVGLLASGGLSLAITLADPLAPGESRKNSAAAAAGQLLTSIGAALVGGGFSWGSGADPYGSSYDSSWPFFLAGGACAAVGIPVFTMGARVKDEQDRSGERARELRDEHSRVRAPALSPSLRVGLGSLSAEWAL